MATVTTSDGRVLTVRRNGVVAVSIDDHITGRYSPSFRSCPRAGRSTQE